MVVVKNEVLLCEVLISDLGAAKVERGRYKRGREKGEVTSSVEVS